MINAFNESLYRASRTRSFADIFPNVTAFSSLYNNGMFPNTTITSTNVNNLYYLLYARFGNSHIANSDENQFKVKVLATIFQYGPAWQKRLSVQTALCGLTESEMQLTAETISNNASNPGEIPTSDAIIVDGKLKYINDQNVATSKRGKIDAYLTLLATLEEDVTTTFLDKFQPLFVKVVVDLPLYYENESEEEES